MTADRFGMARLALAASLLAALSLAAAAAGPFSDFGGAWRGNGQVTLAGGQREQLTCKAYYNAKDGGSSLGVAISCASPSSKIDLRASLVHNGSSVSGSWEERAFNSSGNITGKASTDLIDLSISGTLQAKMSIRMGGGSQSVSISTDGTGFKSVDLKLTRI